VLIKEGIHSLRATRGSIGENGYHYFAVHVTVEANNILRLEFPYDEWLKNEIRSMEGAKWSKEQKCWRIANSSRNAFAWQYLLEGAENPYEKYDHDYPILEWPIRRDASQTEQKIYKQQIEMLTTVMTRRQVILAAEMGTGKTLVVIEAMERAKPMWPLYVGPKYSLENIKREFRMWNAHVMPEYMSYDAMKNMMQTWPNGRIAPDFIVFDESHNLKNYTSQRTQYAKALADGARRDHKNPYIVLMTGTPAPHDPLNWWAQCEVTCPGFVKESSPTFLKYRLSLIERKETMAGGSYPEHITWFDNPAKCKICGQFYDHINHTAMAIKPHHFVSSEDEISKLYRRLKGLVYIKFKKDCLDLPEKVYRNVTCEPSPASLRAMKLITRKCATVIEALTLTRELSDGFQYIYEPHGKMTCPLCQGTTKIKGPAKIDDLPPLDMGDAQINIAQDQQMIEIICTKCEGSGQVDNMERVAKEVPCPKDDALLELLEENEENARIVIYTGFTASVDRICRFCIQHGWDVIRVDGRGQWTNFDLGDPKKCVICEGYENASEHNNFNPQFHAYRPRSAIEIFQDKEHNPQKIAFIGQPGAAGVSLTLTAASMIVYYSNTFNGVDRFQSEDRIHRIGMDAARGAIIVDVIHLPTDQYILDNLQKKKTLQSQSMGDLQAFLKQKEVINS